MIISEYIKKLCNNIDFKVDFKIKNILKEIKDIHIWHRNEVLSGK